MAKKVTILCWSNDKGAAQNRILLWIKGIEEHNVKVRFIPLINTNLKYRGSKILFFALQIIFLLKIIWFERNEIIWVSGHLPNFILRLLKNKNFIFERTEYPTQIIRPENKKTDLTFYRYASKFITCSDALVKYYSNYTKKDCGFIKIPLIVDYLRFADYNGVDPFSGKKYITYCGYMGNNKDGVHDLLEAFSIFSKHNQEIYLCLLGTAEKSVIKELKKKAKMLNISERVMFKGFVQHNDIPQYLSYSKVLLLSRPDNKQAEGGFPSKLGEYMATGNPVLVTSVGEIPEYIKDSENGYMVEPDNPKEFAKKLIYIIANYKEAKKVGLEGQKLANQFNYKIQSKKLLEFF